MKPEQLALTARVDQIVRNKGESDDHDRVESNDQVRDPFEYPLGNHFLSLLVSSAAAEREAGSREAGFRG